MKTKRIDKVRAFNCLREVSKISALASTSSGGYRQGQAKMRQMRLSESPSSSPQALSNSLDRFQVGRFRNSLQEMSSQSPPYFIYSQAPVKARIKCRRSSPDAKTFVEAEKVVEAPDGLFGIGDEALRYSVSVFNRGRDRKDRPLLALKP